MQQLPDDEWLSLEGVDLQPDGSPMSERPRHVLVRKTALPVCDVLERPADHMDTKHPLYLLRVRWAYEAHLPHFDDERAGVSLWSGVGFVLSSVACAACRVELGAASRGSGLPAPVAEVCRLPVHCG